MLRIDAISELEEFFHSKKRMTLETIGREPTDAVTDIYIRGFMVQMHEKIAQIMPELRTRGQNSPPSNPYT